MSAWRTLASVLIFPASIPFAANVAEHAGVVAEFELIVAYGHTVLTIVDSDVTGIFVVDPAEQVVEIFPLNARPTEIAAALTGPD